MAYYQRVAAQLEEEEKKNDRYQPKDKEEFLYLIRNLLQNDRWMAYPRTVRRIGEYITNAAEKADRHERTEATLEHRARVQYHIGIPCEERCRYFMGCVLYLGTLITLVVFTIRFFIE